MNIQSRITTALSNKNWMMPALFGVMCSCFAAIVSLLAWRSLDGNGSADAFTIGTELCAMVVAIMMAISILPTYKRHSRYNFLFFTTLTFGCLALFLDSWEILFDGDPAFYTVNMVASVLGFCNAPLYSFFFWLYACRVLKCEDSKVFVVFRAIAIALLGIAILMPIVNLFYPLYFQISEAGVYSRALPGWFFSQICPAYLILCTAVLIVLSKEKMKAKLLITTFAVLPLLTALLSGYITPHQGQPTIAIEYTAMMVSLVLIYAFLFSDNEKSLHSKSKELGIATSIQKSTLPTTFPAFPERKEFDIFASMDPAKEVGGDFYDFFLVDDDHLALVIADVSDKGIPAALFMMASKIMVENYAMLGQSPSQALASANRQICANNEAQMFVTVWLGIVNLKTGKMTACNAGHENPIIKRPDGHFEVFKDKHSFVVGGSELAIFKEYEIQLEKGSKIFVYTDGLPEAYNGSSRFGMERMVEALVKSEDLSPQQILIEMKKSINEFVGNQDQFDDTTMLCFEYRGQEDD